MVQRLEHFEKDMETEAGFCGQAAVTGHLACPQHKGTSIRFPIWKTRNYFLSRSFVTHLKALSLKEAGAVDLQECCCVVWRH